MNNLSLNKEINALPTILKEVLWQFVRGDISIKTFEQWVYSNDKTLSQAFKDESYLEFMLDYTVESEICNLKIAVYEFLIKFPEECLCNTFPNNTLLYPFTENEERVILEKQIDLLKSVMSIENFSGKPPIYQSRFYHPGELCHCLKCETWWFVIFEETEGADYYLVRLNREDALLILQSSNWPNEH